MIKKALLPIIAVMLMSLFSCKDSTIDPRVELTSIPKYVYYTKIVNHTYPGYDFHQLRMIDLATMEDKLLRDSSMILGIVNNKIYYQIPSDAFTTISLRRCDPDGENDEFLGSWSKQNMKWAILRVSGDGTKVLYYSQPADKVILHCSNVDGTNDREIFTLRFGYHESADYHAAADFTSDSRSINILDLPDNLDPNDTGINIYSCNTDGSGLKLISPLAGYSNALGSWSPNGQYLAYIALVDQNQPNNYKISLFNLDTKKSKDINKDGNLTRNYVWSPNSRKIAYYQDAGKFFVMDADGSNRVQVTDLACSNDLWYFHPDWSKDGNYVVFQTNVLTSGDVIYGSLKMVNLSTMEVKTLVAEENVWNEFLLCDEAN